MAMRAIPWRNTGIGGFYGGAWYDVGVNVSEFAAFGSVWRARFCVLYKVVF